jgi:hypothetical protein
MPTLTELLKHTGATRADYNNWTRQDFLKLDAKVHRRAALLDRPAALEFAFFAALRRAFAPAAAALEVARWMKDEKNKGKFARYWIGNPAQDRPLTSPLGMTLGSIKSVTDLAYHSDLADAIRGGWGGSPEPEIIPAATLVIIDRAAIVERVDALCATDKA